MPSACNLPRVMANGAIAKSGAKKPHNGGTNSLITEAIKRICDDQDDSPAAFVERVFGLSPGGARKKVNGERGYDADDIARALWDGGGFHVLAAIMDAAPHKPLWWRICRPLMTQADAEMMALAAKQAATKSMQRVIAHAQQAQANSARGRAALLVQDEEFYGPAFEADLAVAGLPRRAMATARKTGR